jgi:hypothetical protein
MSDFDKEAERQKLREKFDRDKEKRKETERMSQLLLQGATMTNRHCDACGDPLFRYQGQTFCATCEGRAQEATTADTESGTDGAASDVPAGVAADAAGGHAPERDADPATEAVDGDESETHPMESDAAGHPAPTSDGRPTPADTTDTGAERTAGASPETPSKGAERSGSARSETSIGTGGRSATGDLDAARASLIRTLTHHAQRAEAVDDPRRATDHLTAVREAAEALAALDGSR